MDEHPKTRALVITWPLFPDETAPPFPADPAQPVAEFAPPSVELQALARDDEPPAPSAASQEAEQRLRASVPPSWAAPDWARAAQALIAELSRLVESGSAAPSEQAAIARAWLAWSMGGISEAHLLSVAHLVSRCHTAVRNLKQSGPELHSALRAAAGVLHGRLPAALRERMPLGRVVFMVYELRDLADPWAAVVEGTAELVGWKDYARSHAAALVRTVMEHGQLTVKAEPDSD